MQRDHQQDAVVDRCSIVGQFLLYVSRVGYHLGDVALLVHVVEEVRHGAYATNIGPIIVAINSLSITFVYTLRKYLLRTRLRHRRHGKPRPSRWPLAGCT